MNLLQTDQGQKIPVSDLARTIDNYCKNFTMSMAALGFDCKVTLTKKVLTEGIRPEIVGTLQPRVVPQPTIKAVNPAKQNGPEPQSKGGPVNRVKDLEGEDSGE